ncbi:hypothetical protein RDI58_008959 [Solanum bulbocastanum]|uniref:Uncharacterized protein n=1 Tax=Solanum bulbocastanum TaxID=147425 RepID=A0AAN8YKK6_SOLBU
MNMAITLPASYAGLTVTPPFHARLRRQFTPLATLSTPPNSSSSSRQAAVDWVEETASFFELDNRPIMLFDGVCNLCNGGVKFVRDNDNKRRIRYEALQSEAGKNLLRRSGRAPDDISSVVLVEKDRYAVCSLGKKGGWGKEGSKGPDFLHIGVPFSQLRLQFIFQLQFKCCPDDTNVVAIIAGVTSDHCFHFRSYVKSEAVLKIMEYINLPFPQLAFFLQLVPLFIRDFAYDNVANNRYALFGRSESCEI